VGVQVGDAAASDAAFAHAARVGPIKALVTAVPDGVRIALAVYDPEMGKFTLSAGGDGVGWSPLNTSTSQPLTANRSQSQ
jgi:hypothetical protein